MNKNELDSKNINHLPVHFFSRQADKIRSLEKSGGDVIRLDVGSPDLPPPDQVINSLIENSKNKHAHGYQSHAGIDILRTAWSEWYAERYDVELDPERQVLPLIGSKEGIFHLPLAYLKRGDIVLVPDPGYATYSRGAQLAGGEIVYFNLDEDNNYLPQFDKIPDQIARRARMMWLNYPNNPTGATVTLSLFEEAVRFGKKNNILVCHDAAYGQVNSADRAAPSIMQVSNAELVAVEFNSLSKSHNMAGWRVGVLVGNEGVVRSLFSLKSNADSSQFGPILNASVTALSIDQSWIDNRNEIYRQRRQVVVNMLEKFGFPVFRTDSGIYVWFKIPAEWNSVDFVDKVLEHALVSLAPGSFFGRNGEGFVRLSLMAPSGKLEIAMERIYTWLDRVEIL